MRGVGVKLVPAPVRRRLALLVAATTSVVLLAFTLPLALLIDRAATSNAVTTAADRSQRIVPVVLSGTDGEIRAAVRAVSDADYRMQVTLPGGQVLGRALDVERPAVDPRLRATEAHTLPDGRVVLDQPVLRPDGTAVVSTLLSEAVLDARGLAGLGGARRSWPWCCSPCRWWSPTGWRDRSPRRSRTSPPPPSGSRAATWTPGSSRPARRRCTRWGSR